MAVTHEEAYVFFFQVKEMVDGFIHKLRTTCDRDKVWVCSSVLGKPEINLNEMRVMKITIVTVDKC